MGDAEQERAARRESLLAGKLPIPTVTIERFWSKVDRAEPDQCWLWQGAPDKRTGRGSFSILGFSMSAPRAAYLIAKGAVGNLFACHSCDNPRCVNPAHLWLGTNSENIRDAVNKGRVKRARRTHCPSGHKITPDNRLTRYRENTKYYICKICDRASKKRYRDRNPSAGPGIPRGSKKPSAKLDESSVVVIKALFEDGRSQRSIARQFGLSQATIQKIAAGKTWTHVKPARGQHIERQDDEG